MSLEIHLSSRSVKFLKSTSKDSYRRIKEKLRLLREDPFPHDAKRIMREKEKIFRIRVGDCRILYVVFLDKKAILVVNIDKREKVYKR